MPENVKLGELQKDGRIIRLHIRRGALILGLTGLGLLLTQFLADVRLWIPFAILGVLSITVLGDVIRYIHCGREMKRIQQQENLRSP